MLVPYLRIKVYANFSCIIAWVQEMKINISKTIVARPETFIYKLTKNKKPLKTVRLDCKAISKTLMQSLINMLKSDGQRDGQHQSIGHIWLFFFFFFALQSGQKIVLCLIISHFNCSVKHSKTPQGVKLALAQSHLRPFFTTGRSKFGPAIAQMASVT